jgi:hypothetical protein
MSRDLATPISRIARLEGQLRRAHALACGAVLLAATLLLGGNAVGAPRVIQAERLELVTAQGVRQAVLSADTLGFKVILLDAQGRPAGGLRLNDEPRLTVESSRGREVAGLGHPKVYNLTE